MAEGTREDISKEIIATLAGGCFWCLEAIFSELSGVKKVVSGYSGGTLPSPDYQSVSSGETGHAEAVQITYDPNIITFENLLRIFFTVHDPTTMNRQGSDIGTQYRSVIFYNDDGEKVAAEKIIAETNDAKIWEAPIVTEIKPFSAFYTAEEYHQHYFDQNPEQPYCRVIISPKVAKFRKQFVDMLKK